MKENGRLLELAALAAMAITVLFSVLGFSKECDNVRGAVLRLHVIANSDTAADQTLKLAVRDAILQESGELFAACADREAAKRAAKAALPTLQQAAQRVVAQQGFPYAVKAELAQSEFPTRTYDDVTLPAGQYDAVKITLGSGSGHNWWCVMFPPLCLSAASDLPKLDDVLSGDALALVREDPKYEVRFWLIEKWREMRGVKE